jgi:hypothetical protein
MPKFFDTVAGHRFTEKTLPELISELKKLNENVSSATEEFLPELKRFNDNMEELIEIKKRYPEDSYGTNPGAEKALQMIVDALKEE